MKKIVFVLLMQLIFSLVGQSQDNKLKIISSEKVYHSTNINPLLDFQGNIIGTYEGFLYTEKPADVFVNYNNQRIQIQKPMGLFIAVPQESRLFNYGQEPSFSKDYNLELHILDMSGKWIKNVGVIGHFPYNTAASKNGDFYALTYKDEGESTKLIFIKYDKNGNLDWIKEMPAFTPGGIFISPDGKRLAVAVSNPENGYFNIYFYTDKGDIYKSFENFGNVSNIEFISNDEFIMIDVSDWYYYNIKISDNPILNGKLSGNTISAFPVTISPDKDFMIVLTVNPANEYRVNMISLLNGSIISSVDIKETPFWEAYRMAIFDGKQNIIVKTQNQLVKLELIK